MLLKSQIELGPFNPEKMGVEFEFLPLLETRQQGQPRRFGSPAVEGSAVRNSSRDKVRHAR
jgi:hypothetical protein